MTPIDPSSEPIASPPIATSQEPIARSPFFDYADLFLFVGLTIPCLLTAVLIARAAKIFAPMSMPVQLLLVQSVWYFLAFGCLAVLFRTRHRRPFWQSLGWHPIAFNSAIGALLAGPLLAFGLGLLGSALRTPQIDLPFEQMLTSRATTVFLGVLVVILGPVAEELAFRGFLMPLLIRSIGVTAGIVATGIVFGSIHGYEYQWSWRHMLLISAVGCAFGWARYKSRSTLTSAFMHSTFNLTQFVAFLAQAKSL